MPLAEVTKKTIVLQVFDWDKITKTDGIGEVQILLVMNSTTSIMVNNQPGPDPFVAAQPRHRDQRVEATAQGHRHQWQGGLPRLTLFQYFLYPAAPADHQAVLYGSPWVRNNEMLGIQIRSGKEKKKEPLDKMHIVQDEPNELYGQLASISNRPTTCIAANFSSKAIKVLWLIMMMIIP